MQLHADWSSVSPSPHLGSGNHAFPSQAASVVASLTGKAHRRLQPDYQRSEIALEADWQTMACLIQ